MHLIYSCHNNDKLTGQNQSNERILLFGDSRGITHAYNLKGLACKELWALWYNYHHLHHVLGQVMEVGQLPAQMHSDFKGLTFCFVLV